MSRLAAAWRRVELDAEAAAKMRKALEEGADVEPVEPPKPGRAQLDADSLRGFPAVGRHSAPSAIAGTDPLRETIRRDEQRRRRRS